MFFLLPTILFGLTALGVAWLRLRSIRMAYIWVLIVLVVTVCWILYLILPVSFISKPILLQWISLPDSVMSLQFGLTPLTWGFTFLIISLALGYFLTLPIRMEFEKRSLLWIGWLAALTLTSLLIASQNLVSLAIAWTFLDILDLSFSFFIFRSDTVELPLIPIFLSRILSTLILIITAAISGNGGLFPIESKNLVIPILIFFAGILRSGIFTGERKVDEKNPGKSFSSLLNWLYSISALVLWSQLPVQFFNPIANQIILALLTFFAFISMINFLLRRNNGSKFHLSLIVILAAIALLSGEPKSTLPWAAILISVEALTGFYTITTPIFPIIPLLLIIVISGLPMTPGFFALRSLFSSGTIVWGLVGIILYVIFLLTAFFQMLGKKATQPSTEPWYQIAYFIGLIILIFSPSVLIVKIGLLADDWLPFWWIGVLSVILFTLGVLIKVFINRRTRKTEIFNQKKWIQRLEIVDYLLLKAEWVNEIGKWIGLILQEFIDLLTKLLEGEGGVIWAVVLLALVVSMIGIGGK